jgi:hypothetical protein
MSVLPPAAKGTMMRIVLSGYVCACAGRMTATTISVENSRRIAFRVYGNVIQCAAKSFATDEQIETRSMHSIGALSIQSSIVRVDYRKDNAL